MVTVVSNWRSWPHYEETPAHKCGKHELERASKTWTQLEFLEAHAQGLSDGGWGEFVVHPEVHPEVWANASPAVRHICQWATAQEYRLVRITKVRHEHKTFDYDAKRLFGHYKVSRKMAWKCRIKAEKLVKRGKHGDLIEASTVAKCALEFDWEARRQKREWLDYIAGKKEQGGNHER